MLISDLSHLETTSENIAIIGGSNEIVLAFEGTAYDNLKIISATGTISIKELLQNGVIAKGKGFAITLASDIINATGTGTVSISGDAGGTKTVIKTQTQSGDNSNTVTAISQITVKPITPLSSS